MESQVTPRVPSNTSLEIFCRQLLARSSTEEFGGTLGRSSILRIDAHLSVFTSEVQVRLQTSFKQVLLSFCNVRV
ncbi:hypothetical protein Ccrd_016090 [Cynara cardunculus var. scolymus]|uniref:Uncharacterized protein n=1 Tax=Cynara cardunculus var. scolymus TaxID=59895 RepID=A0A118K389_CYNCS|nr:hypothetical protein Ccrd_016090 [Cynara cardunculus var. scolymus]